MPGVAGNDFCNNPLVNAVIHVIATDAARGVPAVGKIVYDTRIGGLTVCTSTSPNPNDNGGGTWAPVGGAAYSGLSTTVAQGTTVTKTDTYSRHRIGNGRYDFELYFTCSSSGVAGTGIQVLASVGTSTRSTVAGVAAGSFLVSDGVGAVVSTGTVLAFLSAGTLVLSFAEARLGGEIGVGGITLASGYIVAASGGFEIT